MTDDAVAQALRRLPPEHRDAILECFYRGRPLAEAARRLGVAPGTVRMWVYEALRDLRNDLRPVSR